MNTVVIGAGPAGLMAAGSVKNGKVTVLEKNEKAGKKLYITGKGRCNITNDCAPETLLQNVVTNPKFLIGAVHRFSPGDTIDFFKEYGIPLKTERGGRVFPESGKSSDITGALKKHALKNGAQIRLNSEVIDIYRDAGIKKFKIALRGGETLLSDHLILATGGASYPLTGSTGDGYRFAKQLGHTVLPPRPALVPMVFTGNVKPLEKLSLINVAVSLNTGSETYRQFGEILFTAEGVSGPCALSLSSYLSRDGLTKDTALSIDLKPALTEKQLDMRVLRDFENNKNRKLKNALSGLLPGKLRPFIIEYAGLNGETAVNAVTKAQRAKLAGVFKNLSFRVNALGALEKGLVTGGGVDVKEINPKTMESRLIPRLYFAGELIDADALTGGFNIQIALSTGYSAGNAI